jgi:endonuclease G
MKFLIASLLFLCSLVSADTLSVHCPLGCPSNPDSNDLLFSHVYALSNNPQTKFADWVAYEVNVLNFGDSPGRNWKVEKLLDEDETLEADDYDGAHSSNLKADRGHQAPLASFAGSQYWSELNHLSNITPQHKDLNQGPWKALEEAVRSAVSYKKSLYVITGPIYEGTPQTLPNADEPHKVPTGYFKIIYNTDGEAASFVMMQSAGRQDDYCSKQKSISMIKPNLEFTLPDLSNSTDILSKLGC